jgi:dihydroorotase
LETLLSLTLMRPGDAGLAEKLAPVTVGPSRILRLPVPRLELGAVADICIFDPDDWWRVQPADFVSRGRNTPFAGYELRGRVRYCLVGGRVVHGD